MPNFSQIKRVSDGDNLLLAATPAFVAVNARYVAGDHLQLERGGTGEWGGPPPPPEMEREAMAQLERIFTPAPIVGECNENHVSGIAEREMGFEFARAEAPQEGEEISETDPIEIERAKINGAVGRWFDQGAYLSTIQEYAGRGRWAGRATLRFFVPSGVMEQQANGSYRLPREVDSPEKALEYIFLEAPNVESAMVYLDPKSRRKCGLFRYDELPESFDTTTVGFAKKRLEKMFVADADEANRGENRPNIRRGQTVLQVLEQRDGGAPSGVTAGQIVINPNQDLNSDAVIQEVVFNCGGNSLLFEAKLPLLFTDPVRRLQRSVNLVNTLLAINATFAGFRSRDYFNATQMETKDGQIDNGPSRAMFWYSMPYEVVNADGTKETKYFPPTLVTTEPVESGPILEVKDNFERQLRRAYRQEHTMNEGAQVSAVALIQRRALFLISLLQTKPAVEDAMAWVQMTLWCFALYLCGKESEIEQFKATYRATCTAKPYTGPLTPEEIRAIIEMVAARLMPREIGAGLLGTDDLDAYTDAINRQDATDPEMILKRAQIYAELKGGGVGIKAAATIAGMTEEEVTLLTTDYTGAPTP